jgi:activator of 2-hydroxyglutaryl-CoA dehydratase
MNYLGIDLGGTNIKGAVVTGAGEILREASRPTHVERGAEGVADEIAAAKTMTPELGVRLMGDLSTSLAETYDAIGACVGEELRGQVSDLQLVDFVDPSVAEPLIAVQDKIDPQSFRGPR